ncbi:unnamed protein product [Moneuplotes crassus]|uniref:ALMS motif domain-containing protein n=1 Tax=Euplotes crassus TaxID=5936 RepID=A0AAD1UBN7_EUPCR|nr:unnamed protein product [Moneuplotes crassus]
MVDRYYHIVDGQKDVQCKKDGSPILHKKGLGVRQSYERSSLEKLKKTPFDFKVDRNDRDQREGKLRCSRNKLIMPCFTRLSKNKNIARDTNLHQSKSTNFRIRPNENRSKRETILQRSFKTKAFDILGRKSIELRAIQNASTLTADDRIIQNGSKSFISSKKGIEINKSRGALKMPELQSARKSKGVPLTTINSKKSSLPSLHINDSRGSIKDFSKFTSKDRISYFKHKLEQISFGLDKMENIRSPNSIVKNKITKISTPFARIITRENSSEKKDKEDTFSASLNSRISFLKEKSLDYQPYQSKKTIKSFLERDYERDKEKVISSISEEESNKTELSTRGDPQKTDGNDPKGDQRSPIFQKLMTIHSRNLAHKKRREAALKINQPEVIPGRKFKVAIKTSTEMYRYDKSLREKYNQEQVQKEREHAAWDRRILERQRRTNLYLQEQKLKKMMQKEKELKK